MPTPIQLFFVASGFRVILPTVSVFFFIQLIKDIFTWAQRPSIKKHYDGDIWPRPLKCACKQTKGSDERHSVSELSLLACCFFFYWIYNLFRSYYIFPPLCWPLTRLYLRKVSQKALKVKFFNNKWQVAGRPDFSLILPVKSDRFFACKIWPNSQDLSYLCTF